MTDEGSLIRDRVSAPAAPYGRSLLYVATILGRTMGRLYMLLCRMGLIDTVTPLTLAVGGFLSNCFIRQGDSLSFVSTMKGAFIMHKQTNAKITTKTMAYCALLAALSVVLARLIVPMPNATTRFSIEQVPIFLAGMLFGPLPGALVGFCADFVGCLFSGYGYNPIFCIPPILYGLCAGLMQNYLCTKPNLLRLSLGWLPSVILGSILYQSATLAWVYGREIFFEKLVFHLTTRSIQFAVTFVLDLLIVYLMCRANIFKRMGVWPVRKEK